MGLLSDESWGEFENGSHALITRLEKGGIPRIFTHNDADGISSGSIIFKALLREGYSPHLRSVKQLEKDIIDEIASIKPEIIIFTDLGSGQLEYIRERLLDDTFVVILDHHEPTNSVHKNLVHLNAHNMGFDGSREISGSGMAYLFAKALNKGNKDLAGLAIVGAVGDIQDDLGRLSGPNVDIARDGEEAGVLEVKKDLRLMGRQTRPLYKAIEYTTEPFIPGLSGSESNVIQFLKDLYIPIKKDGRFIMLADLDDDQRKRITTALVLRLIEGGVPPKRAERIVGDVFTLKKEEKRTTLRDAREFATLLNSCGKYDKGDIGISVCLGDRDRICKLSQEMLSGHRENISTSYKWLQGDKSRVKETRGLYHFHGGAAISESILGTVAGMLLSSKGLDPLKPVIAFAQTPQDQIKVSGRATREQVGKGINLGRAMSKACKTIGGEGGGHDVAAGAKILKGKEEDFIIEMDIILEKQLEGEVET